MLQHLRKQQSLTSEQLTIGGTKICHKKMSTSKPSAYYLKTDKADKQSYYHSSDPIEIYKQRKKSSKLISAKKTTSNYQSNIVRETSQSQRDHGLFKNKMNNFILKKKIGLLKANQGIQQQSSRQRISKKRLKIKQKQIDIQKINKTQASKVKITKQYQRKCLPQITQKYRSYTTSNSKNKLKKDLFLISDLNIPRQSRKLLRKKETEAPLPDLQFNQSETKKLFKIHRNNTTKIQRIDRQENQSQKIKSISESQKVKYSKKQAKSYKEIIKLTEPINEKQKLAKYEKQKNSKFLLIRSEFTGVINKTNQIEVMNQDSYFNACIEKGNNGMLVKEFIKNRWWWHFVQQNSRDSNITTQKNNKDQPSNIQPTSNNQRKKVNLYWSQWLSKAFAENLVLPSEKKINLKTVYDQFQLNTPQEQQKFNSVKKITDNNTFNQIREKISLRNANYFKNHFPKPISNNNIFSQLNKESSLLKIQKFSNEKNLKAGFKKLQDPKEMKIHNHIVGCLELHSKKLLFRNFSTYLKKKNMDPFDFIPLTFYIEDLDSQNYKDFLIYYDKDKNQLQQSNQNVWILKPGQNSNRGFGISVHKQKQQIEIELKKRLSWNQNMQSSAKRGKKSVIVQKYIEKPFLIHSRKFDFRCYILITTVNGFLKGYWYDNGYIRTSSEEYNLNDIENKMIHLTNDAVQSKNNSFGKFQDYNKLSFEGFRKYLQKQNISLTKFQDALKLMKNIAYYLIASVSPKIKRYQYTFELFGLDFMLDEQLKPYLIQANSNPCLDTKGPILTKIIRNLVQNVIMTAIDPLFPPPTNMIKKKKEDLEKDYFESNKFELIFTDKKVSEQQTLIQ